MFEGRFDSSDSLGMDNVQNLVQNEMGKASLLRTTIVTQGPVVHDGHPILHLSLLHNIGHVCRFTHGQLREVKIWMGDHGEDKVHYAARNVVEQLKACDHGIAGATQAQAQADSASVWVLNDYY